MLVMQKYNGYKVQVAPRLTGDPVVFRKNWRSVDSLSRHEIWGYRKQTDRKPLTAMNREGIDSLIIPEDIFENLMQLR